MGRFKNGRMILTQERVKELFDYKPETGEITRKVKIQCNKGGVGDKPGTLMKGDYTRIVVDGKRIFKHILVWLWNYGVAPLEPIRHINEDHTDDRLCNLTLEYIDRTGTLTQERARELFDYDEKTGVLTRRVKTINSKEVGEQVGSLNKGGYLTARIDGAMYIVHRVIWLWVYGYLPENQLDHIDRCKINNKISNLREVSNSCNTRNCSTYKTNTTGVKGVTYNPCRRKFIARIMSEGETKPLGYFKDFTEAVCHRYAAEQCLSWNDCDANSSAYQYLKQQGIIK